MKTGGNTLDSESTLLVEELEHFRFISASGIPAPAEDADTLAREANKKLRAGQNIMFSGKNEQALEKLAAVSGLLEKNVNRDAP